MSTPTLEPLEGTRELPWTDKPFPWGPITKFHQIGNIAVIEYQRDVSRTTNADPDDHGKTMFHPVILRYNKRRHNHNEPAVASEVGYHGDLSHTFHTLDEAITYAIIMKRVVNPNEARYLQMALDRMTTPLEDEA